MPPMSPDQPPLPPSVVAQQGGPSGMMQFVQGMGSGGEAFPNGMQAASAAGAMDLVTSELQIVESGMGKIMQILATSNPELLTYLKVMAEAGAQLAAAIKQGQPDQTQGGSPSPAQAGIGASSANMGAMSS